MMKKLIHRNTLKRSARNNTDNPSPPPFSLIRKDGKVQRFYLKAMAELYQSLNGGTILED